MTIKNRIQTALLAGAMTAVMPFSSALSEEINVMLGGHPIKDVLMANVGKFTEETGIKVNFTIVGYEVLFERSLLEMGGSSSGFDVIADVIEWVPAYGSSQLVYDLKELDGKYGNQMQFDGVIPAVLAAHQFDNKQYSMPVNAGTRMFFYRKDLLDAAGLKVPETWEELRTAAKALTTGDQFGMSMSAASGPWNVLNWVPYLYSAGGDVWDADKKITVNSEAGVAALQLWVDLILNDKVTPQGVASYTIDENLAAMSEGRVAMATFESVAALRLSDPEKNPHSATMGYGRFPVRSKDVAPTATAVVGGWGMVIPKNTTHEEAAYKFLAWATSAANDLDLAKKVGQGAFTASLENPEVLAKFPALPEVVDVLSGGQLLFPIPEGQELSFVLTTAISDAITGSKTAKEALNDAAEKMTRILDDAGYYK